MNKQTNKLLLIIIALLVIIPSYYFIHKSHEESLKNRYIYNRELFNQCVEKRNAGYMDDEDSATNEHDLDSLAYLINQYQTSQ